MAHSAAHRVFGIPELLENILLQIDPGTLDEGFNCWPGKGNAAVVTSLYALQRINRAFATAIQASKNLRRRMLLEAAPFTIRPGFATRATTWLMAYKGIEVKLTAHDFVCDWVDYIPGGRMEVWATLDYNYKFDKDGVEKRFTAPEASWRKIPILGFETMRPIEIVFMVTTRDEWPLEKYREEWELEYKGRHPTLGDFHDLCVEVCQHAYDTEDF